jgi:hypothetical protein
LPYEEVSEIQSGDVYEFAVTKYFPKTIYKDKNKLDVIIIIKDKASKKILQSSKAYQ